MEKCSYDTVRLVQVANKGDKVYIEGHLSLASWTDSECKPRSGLAVSASKAEKLGCIGRNRAENSRVGTGPTSGETTQASFPIVLPARKKPAFGLFRRKKKAKTSSIEPDKAQDYSENERHFDDALPFYVYKYFETHKLKLCKYMSKPMKNGHDPEPAAEVPNGNTIRMKRYRERKHRGVVVLKHIEVTPDLAAALVQCGWLHESERQNREAILASIGALLYRSLSCGVQPGEKPLLSVDPAAIAAALPWLKPGEAVTPESAGRAVGIVAKCAQQAGFLPEVYAREMRQRMGISETQPLAGARRN